MERFVILSGCSGGGKSTLLAELGRRDVKLTELRTHSASLEDVFVTLTGRHLRDE